MDSVILSVLAYVRDAGFVGLMVGVIVGGYYRWWVWGWQLTDLEREREKERSRLIEEIRTSDLRHEELFDRLVQQLSELVLVAAPVRRVAGLYTQDRRVAHEPRSVHHQGERRREADKGDE